MQKLALSFLALLVCMTTGRSQGITSGKISGGLQTNLNFFMKDESINPASIVLLSGHHWPLYTECCLSIESVKVFDKWGICFNIWCPHLSFIYKLIVFLSLQSKDKVVIPIGLECHFRIHFSVQLYVFQVVNMWVIDQCTPLLIKLILNVSLEGIFTHKLDSRIIPWSKPVCIDFGHCRDVIDQSPV